MAREEPPAREACVSATIDSKVFIWGGLLPIRDDTSHLNYLYCFESLKEKWNFTLINRQHPSGYRACGSAQSGNVVYVYGGCDVNDRCTGSLFSLLLELPSWRELSLHVQNGPKKKVGCGMAVNKDNIIIFGGEDDGKNFTNELHVYKLSAGLWESPIASGDVPQPCSHFSFDVSDSLIILFGGVYSYDDTLDDLYILDVNNMHWTKVAHNPQELWPEKRTGHGSTCLVNNTGNVQLLISGGFEVVEKHVYTDMWLLDTTRMAWRKVQIPANGRIKHCAHTTASVSLFEEFTEVVLFGGVHSYDEDSTNKTALLRFKNKLSSPSSESSVGEWSCTEVAGLDILGSSERVQLKKKLLDKTYAKSCQRVIEEQLSVLIYIARINFVGLPRSGKTSIMQRLIGKILNLMEANLSSELPSTGVAERNQAFIRNVSKCFGFISNSQWSSTDLAGESGVLNQFFHQLSRGATAEMKMESTIMSHNVETDSRESSSAAATPVKKERPLHKGTRLSVADFDKVFATFQEAMDKEDWGTVKYLPEDTMYLIYTDTGGQTEFLDLMSRFLMGPALNLIVSRLTDSLDDVYKIYYTNSEGESTEEEDSVITLEEVLFQALASIACMENVYMPVESLNVSEKDDDIHVPASISKAMFVGTFKDQVSDEEFELKDKALRKRIEQTEFYSKCLVEYASEKHLILPLDNMTGSQKEIDTMREILERIITKHFEKVRIPATWLMLSNNLRHTGKRTITLAECRDMATRVGITDGNLRRVLWFLHYRVGILLYYPEIEGFDEIIILDIQLVFDVVTELIKKTFTFKNVGRYAADVFRDKAQFTMSDLQKVIKYNRETLIPLDKMVVLLEYQKILATLPSDSEEPIYFMPCVLKSATSSELQKVRTSPEIAPLMIRYECGYLPLGIFSSLVIELVSQKDNDWKLVQEGLCRNKIEFQVGDDCDSVTLISRSTFMEVVVFRESDPMKPTFSVCSDIRNILQATLHKVHTFIKYSPSAKFQYGFECPSHPGKEHLSVLKTLGGNKLLCLQNLKRNLILTMKQINHKIWFDEITQQSLVKYTTGTCSSISFWSTQIREMTYLTLIKYYDSFTNERKELRILDELAPKWELVGNILGFKPSEMETIRNAGAGKTPYQYILEVITRWMQNADNMPKSKRYPCTWNGLYNMLVDSKHSTVANDVKTALKASHSDLHHNFDVYTEGRLNDVAVKLQQSDSSHHASSDSPHQISSGSHHQASSDSHHQAFSGSHHQVSSDSHHQASSDSHHKASSDSHHKASSGSHHQASSDSHHQASSDSHHQASSDSHHKASSDSHPQASKKLQQKSSEKTAMKTSSLPEKQKKMNKHELAEWLVEQGVDDDDVNFLKSKGVTEILFLKMKCGDSKASHLSEATIEMLLDLQDDLRNLK